MAKPELAGQMGHGAAGLRRAAASLRAASPRGRADRQQADQDSAGGQVHDVVSGFWRGRRNANATHLPRFRQALA
jgi:hypothetical protein